MPKASLAAAGNQPSRSQLGTKERPPSRVSAALTDAPPKLSNPNMTAVARQPTRPGVERRPTGPGAGATNTQAPGPPARVRTKTAPRIRGDEDDRRPEPPPEPREMRASDFEEPREPSRSVSVSVSSTSALPRTPSLKGAKRTPTAQRRTEERTPDPDELRARDRERERDRDLDDRDRDVDRDRDRDEEAPRGKSRRPPARDAPRKKKKKKGAARADEADGAESVPELDQLEDVEALRARNRRKLVAVLAGTVAAMAFISALIFAGPLKEQFQKPQMGDQDVFLTVDTNIPVTVLVKHHPDEHKKDRYIEEIGQAPGMRKATGAHLRDTIILKNDPLGAYYEYEIQFGVPGTTVTLTKEFQRGSLKLTVLPKKVQNLSVVMNGQEIGKYPAMKIDLYEGKHDLELQGEQLREPVPFTVEIKPAKTADATVDVSKHLL
jgi:hypothetical protein